MVGIRSTYSVNCPFPGSSKNRKLFVLVCTEHAKQAAGWRVIRQVAESVPTQPTQNQHNADDWGQDDEWGDDEEVGWMAQRVEVFELKKYRVYSQEKPTVAAIDLYENWTDVN